MPILLNWLQSGQPDIICLQETKVVDDDFPRLTIEGSGYKCIYRGQKSYNGVAILSRTGLTDIEFGFDDGGPSDDTRLVKARSGKLVIVNTYVPNGYMPDTDKFAYKLEWFKRLRAYFESRFKPADLIVWVGDLNVAPEDIDVYDPEKLRNNVCFHPAAQAALKETMSFGFVDLLRQFNKEPNQYTYWDYRYPKWVKRDVGWRLDHIMTTKSLAKKASACVIDRKPRFEPTPSDHTILYADFNL